MNKRYLVTGTWFDKSTNKPASGIAEITKGINKNGQPYELLNTDRREIIEGTYPVGTILTAKVQIVPETTVQETSVKTPLKINNRP